MLVLARNEGEEIKIGEDIIIKVCKIGKGQIKLGIKCPAQLKVIRTELEKK